MVNETNANQADELKPADASTGGEQGEPAAQGDIAELAAALAAAHAEVESYKDKLLRVGAEMENMRRRAAIDVENAHKFGLEKMANELLPVRDSLELGMVAATGENVDVAKVVEGMDLTVKMMANMMTKFGIKEVNPLKQKFNPEHHQAMTMQEAADVEPNTVINVFQKGYLLNERLLRPAMVVVSKVSGNGGKSGSAKIDEMA